MDSRKGIVENVADYSDNHMKSLSKFHRVSLKFYQTCLEVLPKLSWNFIGFPNRTSFKFPQNNILFYSAFFQNFVIFFSTFYRSLLGNSIKFYQRILTSLRPFLQSCETGLSPDAVSGVTSRSSVVVFHCSVSHLSVRVGRDFFRQFNVKETSYL